MREREGIIFLAYFIVFGFSRGIHLGKFYSKALLPFFIEKKFVNFPTVEMEVD